MKVFSYSKARAGFSKVRRRRSKMRLRATKVVDQVQNKAIENLSKRIDKINQSTELKQLQNNQSSYSLVPLTTTLTRGSGFVLSLLNGSIQGTSTVTRIGDKIKMTSVHISGQLYCTGGGVLLGIHTPIRIVLFLQKKPKGVAPTVSTNGASAGISALFYNTGGSGPTTYQQYDTGVNQNMSENYKILYDQTYTLATLVGGMVPSTDATTSVNPKLNFDIRRKLGYMADYSRGNGGTILDLESNALYVLFITDTNSNITVELDSRVYFKDL